MNQLVKILRHQTEKVKKIQRFSNDNPRFPPFLSKLGYPSAPHCSCRPAQGKPLPPALGRARVQALTPAQTRAPVRGHAPALAPSLSPHLPHVPAAAVLVAVALLLPRRGKLLQFRSLWFYMLTRLVGM